MRRFLRLTPCYHCLQFLQSEQRTSTFRFTLTCFLLTQSLLTFVGAQARSEERTPATAEGKFELWKSQIPVPKAKDLLPIDGVEFHVIKPRVPEEDGFSWLHGAALAWHNRTLFFSFGHNTGAENTATEEANGRISEDGGKSWGPSFQIDAGDELDLTISHGVFLSHEESLWAFHGAFTVA